MNLSIDGVKQCLLEFNPGTFLIQIKYFGILLIRYGNYVEITRKTTIFTQKEFCL